MSDLISREYMKSLGATCIASRSKDGNMFPIVSIDELPPADPTHPTPSNTLGALDCVSRQAAIDAVEFGITYAKAIDVNTGESKELFKEGNDALKKAVERLKELPSAEPEIIRCRDCKHHDGIRCFRWNSTIITGFDDYCSNAERRGESDENR